MRRETEEDARHISAKSSDWLENLGQIGRATAQALQGWTQYIAPCPWPAHAGYSASRRLRAKRARAHTQSKIYTPEERARRDGSLWTLVQGVLAPLQFLVFLVSLALVLNYLATGEGYAVATLSVIVKTGVLYAIMVTGSIWEKVVFGRWLFAPAFFWEDVFSMVVLALHTAYLLAVLLGWGSPEQQMALALGAYATYVINAGQFLWKLRLARLEAQVR